MYGSSRSDIIFYEDRDFLGRSYECSSDCSELNSHLSRCHSVRVESGVFVVYDQPNFTGRQYLLRKGEYPEYQRLMGFSDCIRSCRMIPTYNGSYKMRIYERENFAGQMHELMDDCESIQDKYSMSNMLSCHVMDGHWLMYEQPRYGGRMMYLRPGEYKSFRDLVLDNMRFSSIRRIMDY
uniref:Beta/gamma crystallin 'Greek key' domain-containing protein n=1 Tax=Astyanax mexicanus TaxID=7994 RepID=W5LND2_ASTMX